jgi:hypothetical protein
VRLSTKEENSITGNLAVHYNIFITQLKMSYGELNMAILSINDQATQALNRGAKAICIAYAKTLLHYENDKDQSQSKPITHTRHKRRNGGFPRATIPPVNLDPGARI